MTSGAWRQDVQLHAVHLNNIIVRFVVATSPGLWLVRPAVY